MACISPADSADEGRSVLVPVAVLPVLAGISSYTTHGELSTKPGHATACKLLILDGRSTSTEPVCYEVRVEGDDVLLGWLKRSG